MTAVFIRERKGRLRHREEGHVMMEAETRVMQLLTKECKALLAILEARRQPWNRFFLRVSRQSQPC